MGGPDRGPGEAEQGALLPHEVPDHPKADRDLQAAGPMHAPRATLGRPPQGTQHIRHHIQMHGD